MKEILKRYSFELHHTSSSSDENYRNYFKSYYGNEYMIRLFDDGDFELFIKDINSKDSIELYSISNNEENLKNFLNIVLP